MFDTSLLRPSVHCNTPLHFTTLHPTTLHYTSLHFTQQHFNTLHHTSPNYTSLHFISSHLQFTTLSFIFTYLHFLSFCFTSHLCTRHSTLLCLTGISMLYERYFSLFQNCKTGLKAGTASYLIETTYLSF
jgi:hypothetical protein